MFLNYFVFLIRYFSGMFLSALFPFSYLLLILHGILYGLFFYVNWFLINPNWLFIIYILLFIIGCFWVSFRIRPYLDIAHTFEKHHSLNFKLFNFREQFSSPLSQKYNSFFSFLFKNYHLKVIKNIIDLSQKFPKKKLFYFFHTKEKWAILILLIFGILTFKNQWHYIQYCLTGYTGGLDDINIKTLILEDEDFIIKANNFRGNFNGKTLNRNLNSGSLWNKTPLLDELSTIIDINGDMKWYLRGIQGENKYYLTKKGKTRFIYRPKINYFKITVIQTNFSQREKYSIYSNKNLIKIPFQSHVKLDIKTENKDVDEEFLKEIILSFKLENINITNELSYLFKRKITEKSNNVTISFDSDLIHHYFSKNHLLAWNNANQTLALSINLKNKIGLKLSNPILINFQYIENESPKIEIINEQDFSIIQEFQNKTINFLAEDNMGLSSYTLHAKMYQSILSNEIIKHFSNKVTLKNNPTYLQTNTLFPLKEIIDQVDFNKVHYFIEVEDIYGLKVLSDIKIIRLQNNIERYQFDKKNKTELNHDFNQVSDIDQFKNELEQFKYEKEVGNFSSDHLKSFEKKLDNLNQHFQKHIDSIKKQENTSDTNINSQLLAQKIKSNRKELENIFNKINEKIKDNLTRYQSQSTNASNKSNINQSLEKLYDEDEFERFIEMVKKISKQIDEEKQWVIIENLANSLYLNHENIISFSYKRNNIAIYNNNKSEIKILYEKLLKEIIAIDSSIYQNELTRNLIGQLQNSLKTELITQYDSFSVGQSIKNIYQEAKIKYWSQHFFDLKNRVYNISRQYKKLEYEKGIALINKNIIGLHRIAIWLNEFAKGYIVDQRNIILNEVKKKLSAFFANLQTIMRYSKYDLYDTLGGHNIKELLSVIEEYDNFLNRIEAIKPSLNPANRSKTAKKIEVLNTLCLKKYDEVSQIIRLLLKVKENIMNQKEKNDIMENLQRASLEQSGLKDQLLSLFNQQFNPSDDSQNAQSINPFQFNPGKRKELMQSQNNIQQMIKEALSNLQNKNSEYNNKNSKGQGNKVSEEGSEQPFFMDKKLEKELSSLIAQMQKVKNDLTNTRFNQKEVQELQNKQEKITQKLLRFRSGIKKNEEKELEEETNRKATANNKFYEGFNNSLKIKSKESQKNTLEKDIQWIDYKLYKKKTLDYLEYLNETKLIHQ